MRHAPLCCAVASAAAVFLLGCTTGKQQSLLTGEPIVYSVDPSSGRILDIDTWPSVANAPDAAVVPAANTDVVTVTLDSIFLKYLVDGGSPHVLIYAEVYDDGADDPTTAVTKVLLDHNDQAGGVRLGLAGRVIYGPAKYKGYPLRIRLFALELDKEDKEQASKMLKAAGSFSKFAPPQAALPVGIALDIAEALNQLNQDDYELRLDLTLHPLQPSQGTFTSALASATNDAARSLASGRDGRRYTLSAPLRSGRYLVMKRELKGRPGTDGDPQATTSTLTFDATQAVQRRKYLGTDGLIYRAKEHWEAAAGGVSRVTDEITQIAHDEEKEEGGKKVKVHVDDKLSTEARVILQSGRNIGQEFVLAPGVRQDFLDQTYAVLSVTLGSSVQLTDAQMQASSKRDAQAIQQLLISPAQSREDFNKALDAATSTVGALLEQRQLVGLMNNKVAIDPAYRTSPDFARDWVGQLTDTAPQDGLERRNVVARNSAVLASLREIIVDLPLLRPDDFAGIAGLKTRMANLRAVDGRPGRFRLAPPAVPH